MSNENKNKKPWKIIVFIISVGYIIFMWVKKDIAEIYATMPKQQITPLIVTAALVTLLKVSLIAGALLFIKRLITKFKNN